MPCFAAVAAAIAAAVAAAVNQIACLVNQGLQIAIARSLSSNLTVVVSSPPRALVIAPAPPNTSGRPGQRNSG